MQEVFRGLFWIVPRSVLKPSSVLERRNLIASPLDEQPRPAAPFGLRIPPQ